MGEAIERIGPFRLVRRLGVGGMAEAFEAVRTSPGGLVQRVCVKRVLPAYADDPSFVRLFRREAEMAAGLHHAGIVAVLDVADADSLPYLVLELVDGIDLRALLATTPDRRLPADVVAYLASELADSLAYAHRGDPRIGRPAIVHRDLSPSNVLVGRAGEIKLADFGLAKAIDANPVTQSGTMRGKIPYMAPEHMRGGEIDGRMDLFALGVLLFECLAGRRPFDGAHDVETMTRILSDQRPLLHDLQPDVPDDLAAIVERLLAPEPKDRFPSADALLDALSAAGPLDRARFALADRVESRLGGLATRAHVAMNSERDRVNAHWLAAVPLEDREPRGARPRMHSAPPPIPVASGLDASRGAPSPRTEQITRQVRRETSKAASPVARGTGLVLASFGLAVAAAAGTAAWVHASKGFPASTAGGGAPARSAPPTSASADSRPPARQRPDAPRAPHTPSGTDVAPQAAIPAASAGPHPVADADAPSVDRSRATGTALESAGSEPAPTRAVTRTAAVRVFVHPWGSVWIDHRFVGRAPRTVEISPGSHLIEAGHDHPEAAKRIAVQSGERRSIDLELAPTP